MLSTVFEHDRVVSSTQKTFRTPPYINHVRSRWRYALLVSHIPIPGEDVHFRWGISPFPVRMFISLWLILTGNGDVPHRECTPHQECILSPGMYIVYTGWARGVEVVDFEDILIETWKLCFLCCRTKQDNFSYNWDIYSNKSLCNIEFQFDGSF